MDPIDTLRNYIVHELMYENSELVIGENDNLLGPGLLDSLKILMLVHFVEKRFHISVPQEDVIATKFSTIKAIADYIVERKRQLSHVNYTIG